MHEADDAYSVLSTGSCYCLDLFLAVSHTCIQYTDLVEIFNISLDFSTIYLLVLVDIQLPLCVVAFPF